MHILHLEYFEVLLYPITIYWLFKKRRETTLGNPSLIKEPAMENTCQALGKFIKMLSEDKSSMARLHSAASKAIEYKPDQKFIE